MTSRHLASHDHDTTAVGDDVAGPLDVQASLEMVVEEEQLLRGRAAARLPRQTPALVRAVQEQERRLALTFAGQGPNPLPELHELQRSSARVRFLVTLASAALVDEAASLEPEYRARLPQGIDLDGWLRSPNKPPPEAALLRAPVSVPLVFVAQMGRLEQLLERGLEPLFSSIAPHLALVGHSQGVLGALATSVLWGEHVIDARASLIARMARMALHIGIAMEDVDVGAAPPSAAARSIKETGQAPTAMAAVSGYFQPELLKIIEDSGAEVFVALDHAPLHLTVAGAPTELERFRLFIAQTARDLLEKKKRGEHAGRVVDPRFSWLPVSGPFHTTCYAAAALRAKIRLRTRGLLLPAAALRVPVLDACTTAPFANDGTALDAAVDAILVRPASWRRALISLAQAGIDTVIDVGPGVDVAHLSASALRGRGVAVLAAADPAERAVLLDGARVPPLPEAFARFLPALVELADKTVVVDNKFTRVTGRPPVIVPGMTPTTVEAPIVVASANAGYVAELAGGGQVTEQVLRARMQEILAGLAPGQSIVFNALYLDPYLWNLHLGKQRLVFKLRQEGFPISGVTISAGVPPLEEAVALLDDLFAHGMTCNAFKPGTDNQLDEVLKIAAARPKLPIFVHIEGGKAGGHHSWEDLDDLLVRHYASLRRHENIVVCVGGGIGNEDRAASYITGTWSEAYGLVGMPVDAVFIGTRLMATQEACTSSSVKQALVAAAGEERTWPVNGRDKGGVVAGRSSLDAPIWYLDGSAARVGRLLDEVAGDAKKVAARRSEIVAALAHTAKPYFGDVAEMTPVAVLRRVAELMAVGRGRAFEDGMWLDSSWRRRFVDLAQGFEARFARSRFEPVASLDAAADPLGVIERLQELYPEMDEACVHPDDVLHFFEVCRRPGKPVPFVPTIDADVRRWFKSDSLWQSHDERFSAEQVLAIPGPAAVGAIRTANEPVAEVLASFTHRIVEVLRQRGAAECLAASALVFAKPGGVLARALALMDVRDERNRVWPNPLKRLFPKGDSAVAISAAPDGEVDSAVRHDSSGQVVASLGLVDGAVAAEVRIVDAGILPLCLSWVDDRCGGFLRWEREAFLDAQHAFYSKALFGDVLEPVSLFAEAVESAQITAAQVNAFKAATHDDNAGSASAPLPLSFPLCWRAIFRALAGARPDVLSLVHERESYDGQALTIGEAVTVRSRVVSLEEVAGGRRIAIQSAVCRPDGSILGREDSRFFIRGSVGLRGRRDEDRTVEAALCLGEDGDVAFLRSLEGAAELDGSVRAPCTLALQARVTPRGARGDLRLDGRVVGRITLAAGDEGRIDRLVDLLGQKPVVVENATPVLLGEKVIQAPADLAAYAEASGDRNPLHTHAGVAGLAGFDGPIVHGMWTASAAMHRVARVVANGDTERLQRWEARFIAPVLPGQQLLVRVQSTGHIAGSTAVRVEVVNTDGGVVLEGTATVRPSRTAYVFPGQGVQHAGMGMETYGRSAAARTVWDEADSVCRARHGFSLLTVVRDNPRELWVCGERLVHPDGVLFLTQFTQVALAVMSVAEVADQRARGLFVEDACFAGHSLGEYSALAAVPAVMPLPAVVDVVYQRGLTMDRLVPRDALGRSPYGMAALRPNLAALDEREALSLVEQIAHETGKPLFVVNHNVRGRQYAVTGDVVALGRLREQVNARAQRPDRLPLVDVPGIDVPFHSPLLRGGVAAFRKTLEGALPDQVPAAALHGRYVPNLTGTMFRLEPAFLQEIVEACDSPVARGMLEQWDEHKKVPDQAARALLVEVLAWQFASPVRWIQVQEALLEGPFAVERFVEVGTPQGPVLAGMARAMLQMRGRPARRSPQVLHAVVDAALIAGDVLVEQDALPSPSLPAAEDSAERQTAVPSQSTPAQSTPAQATSSLSPLSSSSLLAADGSLPKPGPLAMDALFTLLATVTKKPRADVDPSRTLDQLLGGNSARRNQVLAEVSAEFGVRAVDNAHELPLHELAATISQLTKYEGPGAVLRPLQEQAALRLLGAAGLDRAKLDSHLEREWGLPPGHRGRLLNRLALRGREAPAANRAAALELVDALVCDYSAELGVRIERAAEKSTAVAVDAGALLALEARILGKGGALDSMAEALRDVIEPGAVRGAPVALDGPAIAADLEHDAAYHAAVAPIFDEKRHVAFVSSWAWARRDLVAGDVDPVLVAGRLDDAGRALAQRLLHDARRAGETPRVRWLEAVRDSVVLPREFAGQTALVTGAGDGSIARVVVARLLERGARVVVTTSRTGPEVTRGFKALYQKAAALGAELHVVPVNQGSFSDVDALAQWFAAPKKERVGSAERVLKAPWVPDIVIPFGAIAETADLGSMGPRSLAMFRVLVLGVERLVARMAEVRARGAVAGSRMHVLLPLSPNHGTFGGDGAYGECKAALEALLQKQQSEAHSWGAVTSIVGARIGWVRGTGLMHQNDGAAAFLEKRGLKTFSQEEMAALLLTLTSLDVRERAARGAFVEDLTGGLGEVHNLAALLAEYRTHEARAMRSRQRCDALRKAFLHDDTAPPEPAELAPLPRVRLDISVPASDELAGLPALDHLDLDEVVVVVGYGEVGPWGSARTRWAVEAGSPLSVEAALELAWMMGFVRPSDNGSGFVDVDSGRPVNPADAVEGYADRIMAHAGVRVMEPARMGFDSKRVQTMIEVRLDRDFRFPVPSRDVAAALVAEDPHRTVIVTDDGGALFVVRRQGSVVRVPAALAIHRHVAGQLPTGWDATRYGIPKDLVDQVDPVTLYCLVSTAEAFLQAGMTPEELYEHLHPGRVGVTIGTGIGGMSKLKRLYRDFHDGAERQNDALQETLINVIGGYVVQSYLGSYGPMSFPVGACATAGLSVAEAVDKIRRGHADLIVAGGADDLSEAGVLGFGDMGATADTDELAARGVEPRHMSRSNDSRRRGFVEAQGAGVVIVARASLALKLGLPVYGVVGYAGTSGDGLQKSVPAPGQGALSLAAEHRADAFDSASDSPSDSGACDLAGRRAAIAAATARKGELARVLGEAQAEAIVRDVRRREGHTFFVGRDDISPLRGALAVLGLTADDVGLASKHDSSTQANDLNEARLYERIMNALGRSADNPLLVISQKALTGHPKGAAAAWQMNGLMQVMGSGVVPGNASLDDVDADMRTFPRLVLSDVATAVPMRHRKAGFVTTLGFGHVSALVCLAHPYLFWRMLSDGDRVAYMARLRKRRVHADSQLQRVLSGRAPLFVPQEQAPLPGKLGDQVYAAAEAAMLTDARARLRRSTEVAV